MCQDLLKPHGIWQWKVYILLSFVLHGVDKNLIANKGDSSGCWMYIMMRKRCVLTCCGWMLVTKTSNGCNCVGRQEFDICMALPNSAVVHATHSLSLYDCITYHSPYAGQILLYCMTDCWRWLLFFSIKQYDAFDHIQYAGNNIITRCICYQMTIMIV